LAILAANSFRIMKRVSIWGFIFGLSVLAARGDVIPTLSSTSPVGSNFTWNYSANVTVDQNVETGDFFTIYDFGNFVTGSNHQPTGWTFSSALSGKNPLLVTPVDNASILNLTWTYTGAAPINGSSALGIFSIVTNTNQLRTSDFAAEATRNTGPNTGTKIDNIGNVSVPVPEMSALLPILSVCGAGLLSLLPGFLRRRRAG
jgi:hypothetical protein